MVSIAAAIFIAALVGIAQGCNRLGVGLGLSHQEQNETSHKQHVRGRSRRRGDDSNKMDLKNMMEARKLDSCVSEWGHVASSCEYGNEPSCSIKCVEFLDYLKKYNFCRRTLLYGIDGASHNTFMPLTTPVIYWTINFLLGSTAASVN